MFKRKKKQKITYTHLLCRTETSQDISHQMEKKEISNLRKTTNLLKGDIYTSV